MFVSLKVNRTVSSVRYSLFSKTMDAWISGRSARGLGTAGEELSASGALGVGDGELLGTSDVVGAVEAGADGSATAGVVIMLVNAITAAK
ncbi:hypothetical protein [Amycolatopsis sp. cmx-4-54]|uniref:hypothetical protein n=1 Tax=Amycolatopsis sp. cmx-4-54 TaxID=2790936 RepID=UPI003979B9CB